MDLLCLRSAGISPWGPAVFMYMNEGIRDLRSSTENISRPPWHVAKVWGLRPPNTLCIYVLRPPNTYTYVLRPPNTYILGIKWYDRSHRSKNS